MKNTTVKKVLVKPAKDAKKLVALYGNEGCNAGNCGGCSVNVKC
jgi:hypothetical protein